MVLGFHLILYIGRLLSLINYNFYFSIFFIVWDSTGLMYKN